jgi:hypothetical protein
MKTTLGIFCIALLIGCASPTTPPVQSSIDGIWVGTNAAYSYAPNVITFRSGYVSYGIERHPYTQTVDTVIWGDPSLMQSGFFRLILITPDSMAGSQSPKPGHDYHASYTRQ